MGKFEGTPVVSEEDLEMAAFAFRRLKLPHVNLTIHDSTVQSPEKIILGMDGMSYYRIGEISSIEPVWRMSIQYELKGKNGDPVKGKIQNTIHQLQ